MKNKDQLIKIIDKLEAINVTAKKVSETATIVADGLATLIPVIKVALESNPKLLAALMPLIMKRLGKHIDSNSDLWVFLEGIAGKE